MEVPLAKVSHIALISLKPLPHGSAHLIGFLSTLSSYLPLPPTEIGPPWASSLHPSWGFASITKASSYSLITFNLDTICWSHLGSKSLFSSFSLSSRAQASPSETIRHPFLYVSTWTGSPDLNSQCVLHSFPASWTFIIGCPRLRGSSHIWVHGPGEYTAFLHTLCQWWAAGNANLPGPLGSLVSLEVLEILVPPGRYQKCVIVLSCSWIAYSDKYFYFSLSALQWQI